VLCREPSRFGDPYAAIRADAVYSPDADHIEIRRCPSAEFGATCDEPCGIPAMETVPGRVDDCRPAAATAHVVAQRRFGWCTHDLLGVVYEQDFTLGEILHKVEGTPCLEDSGAVAGINDPDVLGIADELDRGVALDDIIGWPLRRDIKSVAQADLEVTFRDRERGDVQIVADVDERGFQVEHHQMYLTDQRGRSGLCALEMSNDMCRRDTDVAVPEPEEEAGRPGHILRKWPIAVMPADRPGPPKAGRVNRLTKCVRFLVRPELERRIVGRPFEGRRRLKRCLGAHHGSMRG